MGISIKVETKQSKNNKTALVKDNKDAARWLALLWGDFEKIYIQDNKPNTKEICIVGKFELETWIANNK